MLTTSNTAKAVQVCSSKAFVAVQAIIAITMKAATERTATGKIFDFSALEVKMSLQQTNKGYISEISEMVNSEIGILVFPLYDRHHHNHLMV